MPRLDEVVDLMRATADPCESVRQKAEGIADRDEAADIRQASADLATTIEHMFEIANYIMRRSGSGVSA